MGMLDFINKNKDEKTVEWESDNQSDEDAEEEQEEDNYTCENCEKDFKESEMEGDLCKKCEQQRVEDLPWRVLGTRDEDDSDSEPFFERDGLSKENARIIYDLIRQALLTGKDFVEFTRIEAKNDDGNDSYYSECTVKVSDIDRLTIEQHDDEY